MKPCPKPNKTYRFNSVLERISQEMEYYAVSVPKKITLTLGTRSAVPVSASINGSMEFIASFYPVGGGRHYLRVKNKICQEAKITAGSRVIVQFTVRNLKQLSIPKDLRQALKTANLVMEFAKLPIGKKSYLLRLIQEAKRPETRRKKIQATLDAVRERVSRE